MCYGKAVPCGSVSIFGIHFLIYVSFLQHIHIYGRNDTCYGKTIPCGTVSIFVILILLYVSFLPYIFGRNDTYIKIWMTNIDTLPHGTVFP